MLLRVFGEKDFAHASLAQSAQDAIMSDELRRVVGAHRKIFSV
jgi:hypothetical protein